MTLRSAAWYAANTGQPSLEPPDCANEGEPAEAGPNTWDALSPDEQRRRIAEEVAF